MPCFSFPIPGRFLIGRRKIFKSEINKRIFNQKYFKQR